MCRNLRRRVRDSHLDDSVDGATQKHSNVGYALTRNVVAHHTTPNDAWVIYNGGVYDITLFLQSHPGGAHILYHNLGSDVTDLMQNDTPPAHFHSPFAYKMLEKYKIGTLLDADGQKVADGNFDPSTGEQLVHWDKPILHQVGMLGPKYERWIHSFPTTDHTVKMFTNNTIESLTKCPWYVPLLFWLPIITLEFIHYVSLMGGLSNISLPLLFSMCIFGLISWLLFEYSLHRFVFHLPTTGYYSNIFHFIVHGHHHITPMDFDRLVFPPVPALMLASPFWYLSPKLFGIHAGYPWIMGFALGYLMYDMTHFWIHYAVPTNSFLKMQKRRHVHHHYFKPDANFGISNPLFDFVFNTICEPQR